MKVLRRIPSQVKDHLLHFFSLSSFLQKAKKKVWSKEKEEIVRMKIELTTLALSAPRSADWANGPNNGKFK